MYDQSQMNCVQNPDGSCLSWKSGTCSGVKVRGDPYQRSCVERVIPVISVIIERLRGRYTIKHVYLHQMVGEYMCKRGPRCSNSYTDYENTPGELNRHLSSQLLVDEALAPRKKGFVKALNRVRFSGHETCCA
jgi:hypothetical protein